MSDQNDDNVDLSLQEVFKKKQTQQSMKALGRRIAQDMEKKDESDVALFRLKECINEIGVLKVNLEIYTKKAEAIIYQLERLEAYLKKETNK